MFHNASMLSIATLIAVFGAVDVMALKYGADPRRDGFTL
jgi:hypothetical protein